MPFSDFDGAVFWPGIRQFVIDAGVEPISLGEPEDEIWRKIFAADAATNRTLSMGMDSGALMRAAYALAYGTGGGSVWRASAYGSRIAVQGFNNTSARYRITRNRRIEPIAFRFFRLAIPVFYPAGVPIVDTLYTGAQAQIAFQVGLEYPYVEAVTGLAARIPVTFGGLNYATYDNATWDGASGWIYSDVIDMGQAIPANTAFGLWTTFQLPSAGVTVLPYTQNGSNFIDRNIGFLEGTGNAIAALGGASDLALASTSVSKFTTTQGGASQFFDPCVMLMQVPASTKSIVSLGDSINYGVGEGVTGSGSFGDVRGDINGCAGILDRNLFAQGLLHVNLGRGSDGNKYTNDPVAWKYRREIMAWSNPTHIINQNIFNDMAMAVTYTAWAATTPVLKHAMNSSGGIYYYCLSGGTTGTTALSSISTTTGATISDGGAQWYVMGGSLGGSAQAGTWQVLAWMAKLYESIRTAVPSAPIIQSLASVSATGTYDTTANQTPGTGFAVGNSRRSFTNTRIATPHPILGAIRVFDPRQFLEDSYPTETSKWVVNGVASYATNDGAHPNSRGYDLAKVTSTAGLFD